MKHILDHAMVALVITVGCVCIGPAVAAPKDIQLPPETAKLKPSKLAGYVIAQQKCATCHSADYINYQPPGMSQTQWTAEMTKMQHTYGAPIDDGEIKLLGIYLAATYGDARSVSAADMALTAAPTAAPGAQTAAASGAPTAAIDVQALLSSNACLGCHALTTKIVGPAYHDVALKYKGDAAAVAKLEASIKNGGAGKWGQVPMPPFATLTNDQLKALADFVLKQ